MKKIIIILILSIFLLSGCSVQYNLEINKEGFKENISIGKFDADNVEGFQYLTPYAIVNGVNQEFYKLDYSNQILNLSYDYGVYNYDMSEALNQCYDMSNFSYDNNYYYILTSGEFKCLSYMGYTTDEVRINIKSDYNVVESNADLVENNVYTWIINKNNKGNKPIDIVFDINNSNNLKGNNKLSQFSTFFLVIGAFVIVGIIILFVYLHGKKKNKI